MAANRVLIVAGLVVLVAMVAIAALLFRPAAAPSATPTAIAGAPSATPGTNLSAPPATDPLATPTTPVATETPVATPTSVPASAVDMPFVPVVGFWSTESSVSMDDLRAAANGGTTRYPRVVVPAEDFDVLAGRLGGASMQSGTVADVEAAVKEGALGILRATDVTQRVHALAIDGVSLFGNDRVAETGGWPLQAQVLSTEQWQQAGLWTLVAAGDVMMDRGVAFELRNHPEGGDYLFDGGTARITGIRCCSFFGYDYPTTERTGNRGAVRELFQGADVAMANLESAVLVDAPYHAAGFTFTADASLLDSVDDAGFDFMSLANNHVRNAGERGILTAVEELDKRGIAHSGVGLAQDASTPGYVEANGVRVAIISCDAIRPGWEATASRVGTLNCKRSDVAGTIRSAREDGADVVIVFPHWCCEYKPTPPSYAPDLAQQWFDAGADLITGAHSHIAGAIGDFDGHLAFFSMGNLIFDQDFRQSTMMGVIPEMTFSGSQLVQIELHPTLIIDAQPNLIAPNDGGQFVIDQMRLGSEGLLDY